MLDDAASVTRIRQALPLYHPLYESLGGGDGGGGGWGGGGEWQPVLNTNLYVAAQVEIEARLESSLPERE